MKKFDAKKQYDPKYDLGDHLVSAAVSAFFGLIIGFVVAWMLGVYSHSQGISKTNVDVITWVMSSSLIFGIVGLVLGPKVGTLIGVIISGIYEAERASIYSDTSANEIVLILGLIAAIIWWFFF